MKHQLTFRPMYEVGQLSAIYPTIETAEPFTRLMPKMGLYADKHFLYYSTDGIATAYYEELDMKNAGEFTYKLYSQKAAFEGFRKGIEASIQNIILYLRQVKGIDVFTLEKKEILSTVLKNSELEANIFSYYNATQPQHFALFEHELKKKLEAYVTDAVELDKVIALLSTHHEPTMMSHEELDWLKLIRDVKLSPDIAESKLHIHFDKYKTLLLGDGNWTPKIEHYRGQLKTDLSMSDSHISERILELENAPSMLKRSKEQLIERLKLDDTSVYLGYVLAEVGHLRLRMRTEGFVPLAYRDGEFVTEALAQKYNIHAPELTTMTYMELKGLKDGSYTINVEELASRVDKPYLLVVDDADYYVLFGETAVEKFEQLVDSDLDNKVKELTGNTAMGGVVTGTAFLFRWGDNLQQAIAAMPSDGILVTGQTRPQLMPIIRKGIGIITDEGGIMSHAAIVARELKMPCLVGAMNATKLIRSGDKIRLNASDGIVTILDRSSNYSSTEEPVLTVEHKPHVKLKDLSEVPDSGGMFVPFREVSKGELSLIGGKGASLVRLIQAGLPVPDGFVITTDAYRKLNGYKIPSTIQDELLIAFDNLGAERVAVRSSAVAEDSSDSSWAGQFDTVLNVTRNQLVDAVLECWSSADSELVKEYAKTNAIPKDDLALAVVVQAMVDSEVSGVVFTKNPVSNSKDEIVIEACLGLGEMLVQGMVTPDNFVLSSKDFKLISHSHNRQNIAMKYINGKTEEVEVENPEVIKLEYSQLVALRTLTKQIELLYRTPQDIEWALKDGNFFILQSRPITT